MPSRFKRLFKGLLIFAIACAVAILGAVGCWIYPDVSSLRAICAASANSVYPAHVVHALVAAEDPQFLENSHRRYTGASTLVEQLVKFQSVPTRQITWLIKQMLVATVIERTTPRSQIVSAYLDHVYLGSVGGKHLYGVPAGARAYFGRAPRELTLAQAAMLAGIIRSPHQYSPIEHPEKAAERQQVVLEKMRALKFITEADFDTAIRRSATAERN
jgi:membrane peptidoglycan carboxypeptidase